LKFNSDLSELFEKNRAWAEATTQQDPGFFSGLAAQQTPDHLWIGCSDSRVPANQITGLPPGEIFVHRNIANVVVHTDLNCLSVLQYAVEVLKVQHVIVCGHYGCGGVRAAAENQKHGLIDNWLRHIQDVAHLHRDELAGISDDTVRLDRLCELNVIEQVVNVCRTTVVQGAWERGQPVMVHGWIYRISDGILQNLGITVAHDRDLETQYQAVMTAPPR
jgi:carbonic anhydrase